MPLIGNFRVGQLLKDKATYRDVHQGSSANSKISALDMNRFEFSSRWEFLCNFVFNVPSTPIKYGASKILLFWCQIGHFLFKILLFVVDCSYLFIYYLLN